MNRRTGISAVDVLITVVIAAAIATAIVVVVRMDPTGQKPPPRDQQRTRAGQSGPGKMLYEEVAGAIATGFAEARGLAVGGDGRVYVAGDNAIRVFTAEGQKVGETATRGRPLTLAVGTDGTMYAAMSDHVEVYAPGGKHRATWEPPAGDAALTSIAVSATQEDVFAAGVVRRWGQVFRYRASDGKLLQQFGGRPKGPVKDAGFITPSLYFDVAVGAQGWLWVVNPGRQRVEAYAMDCGPVLDVDGKPLRWGGPGNDLDGFCGCCNPANFAILPGGRFVTAEKGLTRVKVYDPAGKFLGVVAGPGQFVAHDRAVQARGAKGQGVRALDVAADKAGRVFVLDPASNKVRVFRPKPQPTRPAKGAPARPAGPPAGGRT